VLKVSSRASIIGPCLIHPRLDSTATTFGDLLDRLNYYGKVLCEVSNGRYKKLVILAGLADSSFELFNKSNYEFLEIIRLGDSTINSISFGFKASRFLRKTKSSPNILIAGDLWVGLPASLMMKLLSRKNMAIQASLHGDPLSVGIGYKFRIKKVIKQFLLKFLLKRVDSIRVVSRHLADALAQKYGVPQDNIFIAPIPLKLSTEHRLTKTGEDIAIIGRLHEERGLRESLSIMTSFIESGKSPNILVIGEGPLSILVNEWKIGVQNSAEISVLGQLKRNELENLWPRIQILLSSALQEGYGMTIREAILQGTAVIARENQGTLELKETFSEAIHLYRTEQEAVNLLLSLSGITYPESTIISYRKMQTLMDRESTNKLITSWISESY